MQFVVLNLFKICLKLKSFYVTRHYICSLKQDLNEFFIPLCFTVAYIQNEVIP